MNQQGQQEQQEQERQAQGPQGQMPAAEVQGQPAGQPAQPNQQQAQPSSQQDQNPGEFAGQDQNQNQEQYDDSEDLLQEYVLLIWEAPERPYKKRGREYYTTMGVIVGLLCLILFFAGQFLPIAVVLAFAFVSYAMSAVPPENSLFGITTYGVRWDERIYYWNDIARFWFTKQLGHTVLNLEHSGQLLSRVKIVVGEGISEDDLTALLSEFAIRETPMPTVIEKAANWLSEKVPLEKSDES